MVRFKQRFKKLSYLYCCNQNLLTLIVLIAIIFLIFVQASNYSSNLDYKPYNGDFQTFNSSRRIFLGELPGRDFNPYLGLGPTYLNAFVTYVFGGNFAASKFSTFFTSLSLHFLALIVLFFLSGFTLKRAVIASSFFIMALCGDTQRINPIWELAGPGNSNLGIRSALPFITSLVVFLFFRFFRRKQKLFYCIVGCIVGIQPLWSNDYGIPSCLALAIVIIIDLIKQERADQLTKATIFFTCAFSSFIVFAYLLTAGNFLNWWEDNFSGIASEQFWYFSWYNGKNKIFSLADIFSHSFIYLYAITLVFLWFYIAFKNYALKSILLLYIATSVLGAGILSSLGGTINTHYYLASVLVYFFLLFLMRNLLTGSRKVKDDPKQHLNLSRSTIVIFIFIYVTVLGVNTTAHRFFPNHYVNNELFFVKELGGRLPIRWIRATQIARNIKKDLQSELPNRKILSTYSTGMNVIANAVNSTSTDYIIHALGDSARSHYLQQFNDVKPKYITTLREDFSKWETWVRRTNWWFYREFFNNYQPVEATFYNIIWQRLERPKPKNNAQAVCRITQKSNNKVGISVATQKKSDDTFYVEISLKYHLEVKPSGIPIIGTRGLVNATETALTRAIGEDANRSYGLPPAHDNWHIPIEHRLGTVSVLEINGYPEERSRLVVEACQAQLIAPVTAFTFTRSLTATNLSNHDWKNGVFVLNKDEPSFSHAGFVISNQAIVPELYPGMDVEFARSGRRQIIKVKNNQVWVTGAKLDPLADGYPHPILVTLR